MSVRKLTGKLLGLMNCVMIVIRGSLCLEKRLMGLLSNWRKVYLRILI